MGSSAVLVGGVGGGGCGEPALTNQPTAGSLLKGRRPRDKQTRTEKCRVERERDFASTDVLSQVFSLKIAKSA